MREVVLGQVLLIIETLQRVVEFLLALLVNLHVVALNLVVGDDTHLVVATEGLDLGRTAKLLNDRLTDILGDDILVEAHHIAATAGEIDTALQTEGAEGDDGDEGQCSGDDVTDLTDLQEVEMGVREGVDGGGSTHGEVFTLLQTGLDNHSGHQNGGEQGGEDTDDQRGGETLDGAGTEDVQHDGRNQGGDVTVDDGGVGVLEALIDRHADTLTGAHFLAHAFIYNHVRINGHTQGQDDTGDTRQRQDGAHGGEHADDEEDVQQQGEVSDQTGAAVVQEHVDDDQQESAEEGEQTGFDGLLTERRSDDFGLDDVDTGLQVTGVEHGGKVLGLFDGEVTGDFGVTVRNLGTHRRGRIDELVEDDGDAGQLGAVVGSLAGNLAPLVGGLVLHRHGDDHAVVLVNVLTGGAHHAVTADGLRAQQRSDTVVLLLQRIERVCGADIVELLGGAPIEDHVRVGENSLQVGQHLVNLRHVGLLEVGDGDAAASDRMAEDGTLANLGLFLVFILVFVSGSVCSGEGGIGGRLQRSVDGGVSLVPGRLGLLLVLEFLGQLGVGLGEALLDGTAADSVVIDLPELQLGGALQQVGNTLGLLHARQLHEDTAALQHLQVGLCHTETVDTGAQDLEGAVDDLVTLLADVADDVSVGGILQTGTLAEVGAQVGVIEVQRLLLGVEVLHEDIDKVAVHRVLVLSLSLLESVLEELVVGVGGQALDSVRHGDLEGHVHTALQVQTQVQLLVLALFVGVSEIDGRVVHVGQILPCAGIDHRVNQMFLEHNVAVSQLLHFLNGCRVVGEFRRLALHPPRGERERQTVDADQRN